MKSSNPHSGCRKVDVAYSIENHPADSRVKLDESGKVQTLTSRMGTGGGNVLMVMEAVCYDGAGVTSPINASNPMPGDPCHTLSTDSRNLAVICLQGNGIDRADTAGCNGKGWKEDTSYTLNTIDRPAVVYAVDQGGGKSSANVSENTAPTLRAETHGNLPCVLSFHLTQDPITGERITPCLSAGNPNRGQASLGVAAPICLDRAFYNQGTNAKYDPQLYVDECPTLIARGPAAVAYKNPPRYIVRRLTPTECARLQGFPDKWGHITPKTELTDEEYCFWLEVRKTHDAINGRAVKHYNEKQMLAYYNKLWTDSAEYKMWGNGVALPCVLYVMQGIKEALDDLRTSATCGA